MRGCRRYDPEWDGIEWKVECILWHRVGTDGELEYLIKWKDIDPDTGKKYEPSYQPDADVSDDLIDSYLKAHAAMNKRMVRVDILPAVENMRRTAAQAVAIDKTRAEPLVHHVPCPVVSLEPLALAVLKLLAERGGTRSTPLEIQEGASDKYCEKTLVVTYTNMTQVAAFCNFEHFIGADKAVGALRFDIGRTSNFEISCVAFPLRFQVSYNKHTPGLVTFEIVFPTVRFNGAYGTPEHPQLNESHVLRKEPAALGRVVHYVKTNLPKCHPLVGKGWTALPATRWELDDDAAVPA